MKKIEFFFKSILLKLLLIFNPVKKEKTPPVFSERSNLLFIRLNRIGDALVTTPILHEIKHKTGCRIIVLADKRNHFIFRNNPSIDEVIVFRKGLQGILGINKIITEKKIDAIVDLHDDISTTVSFLIALSAAKYKFGLNKINNALYTHTVERLNALHNHIIFRLLKMSELFGFSVNSDSVSVRYFPAEEKIIQTEVMLKKLNPENKFLLGINISAGSQARYWGTENYKKLVKELSVYNAKMILFCTKEDYLLAQQIGNEGMIYPFTEGFDIFVSAVLKLDFLFTPDTSVVQIASMNKIPMFGLYVKYKTDDMIWTPINTDFECVITEEPTLQNISFEEVKKKLIPFLEKHLNAKTNTRL